MILLEFVTLLSIILYMVLSYNVGWARGKYKVPAPHTTGDEGFMRYHRVQMNTLEQLVAFLPSMWLFSFIWSAPLTASCFGLVWIVGRILYAKGYYTDPKKRTLGFVIALSVTSLLMLGGLVGLAKTSMGM